MYRIGYNETKVEIKELAMVREIIIPKSENYNLHIPKEYIDQEVEILVLPLSKIKYTNKQKKTFKQLTKETAGLLSGQNIDPLKWQEEIRSEWDEREEILNRLNGTSL